MTLHYATVWLDHNEAHVFHFNSAVRQIRIQSETAGKKLHIKAGQVASGKTELDPTYYCRVAEALSGGKEILVMGPGSAKNELIKHIETYHEALSEAVIGVETVEHLTDYLILQYAKRYFKAVDRLLPQL